MVLDTTKHYPVLLNEIISIITPQHGGTFIDCTFGQGGYTNKILSFKNSQVIGLDRDPKSKKEADKILREDSTYHANKLRKIFIDWEEQGLNILITQGMFDALLSLSFNGGASGIRRSDVIALLKKSQTIDNEKINAAAESIKTYRISKKFPGLAKRREKEYQRFIEGL